MVNYIIKKNLIIAFCLLIVFVVMWNAFVSLPVMKVSIISKQSRFIEPGVIVLSVDIFDPFHQVSSVELFHEGYLVKNYTKQQKLIKLTGLRPGNYSFVVIAKNSHGNTIADSGIRSFDIMK